MLDAQLRVGLTEINEKYTNQLNLKSEKMKEEAKVRAA